jgi:hypothetical protein
MEETPIILERRVPLPRKKPGKRPKLRKGTPRSFEELRAFAKSGIAPPQEHAIERIDTGEVRFSPVIDKKTGKPKMRLATPAGDRFGLRYEQVSILEAMSQRRQRKLLEQRVVALETRAPAGKRTN